MSRLARRLRAVIFDLDGTLVDSYVAIARSLNHARAAYELPALPVDEVRRSVGHGLEQLIARWVGPDRVEDGVRLFRECYSRVYAEGTRALPGAAETLETLGNAGFGMCVASNKPARFSIAILESLDLLRWFRAVHGPDTTGVTKPDPRMLRRCLEELRVEPDDAIYVGDMALDVETADRAGLEVFLVPGGSSGSEELLATGRRVLRELADLPRILVDPGGRAIRPVGGAG